MSTIVKPCHRNRTPRKVTVQYRDIPYFPPQILITEHYGSGVPLNYLTGWRLAYETGTDAAERIAQSWHEADNGIDPDVITVLPDRIDY